MHRIRLWIPAPVELLTLNTARGRIHWRKWAAMTKAWREAAKVEAEVLPFELVDGERVLIEALPVQLGGILADPGAHMPTLKACVDGLRDAGWLRDDSGRYVAAITMLPPVKASPGQGAGMVLDLTPVPAVAAQLF